MSPDYFLTLDHIWTEPSSISRQNGGQMATKAFLSEDLIGDTFICYLQSNFEQLALAKYHCSKTGGFRGRSVWRIIHQMQTGPQISRLQGCECECVLHVPQCHVRTALGTVHFVQWHSKDVKPSDEIDAYWRQWNMYRMAQKLRLHAMAFIIVASIPM